MTTCMGLLGQELCASVLAAKEDATTVNIHDIVPGLFRHLVHHAVMLSAAYTGIVDHSTSQATSD